MAKTKETLRQAWQEVNGAGGKYLTDEEIEERVEAYFQRQNTEDSKEKSKEE